MTFSRYLNWEYAMYHKWSWRFFITVPTKIHLGYFPFEYHPVLFLYGGFSGKICCGIFYGLRKRIRYFSILKIQCNYRKKYTFSDRLIENRKWHQTNWWKPHSEIILKPQTAQLSCPKMQTAWNNRSKPQTAPFFPLFCEPQNYFTSPRQNKKLITP